MDKFREGLIRAARRVVSDCEEMLGAYNAKRAAPSGDAGTP